MATCIIIIMDIIKSRRRHPFVCRLHCKYHGRRLIIHEREGRRGDRKGWREGIEGGRDEGRERRKERRREEDEEGEKEG